MKYIALFILVLLCLTATAQTKIRADRSAGTIYNGYTTAELNSVTTKPEALLVYNNETHTFWYYNGTQYVDLGAGGSGTTYVAGNGLTLSGTEFSVDTNDAIFGGWDRDISNDVVAGANSPTQDIDLWVGNTEQFKAQNPINDIVVITDSIPGDIAKESKVFVDGNGAASFLNSIVIPEGVKYIPDQGFSSVGASAVSLPSSLDSIGASGFLSNFLRSIDLNEGLIKIDNSSFNGNRLTSISFPSTLEYLGSSVFANNDISGEVIIPSNINTVGEFVFLNNQINSVNWQTQIDTIPKSLFSGNKITSITLNSAVKVIDASAFFGNELTNLNLPDTIEVIGSFAFSNNKITSFTYPASLNTIGGSALSNNDITGNVVMKSTISYGVAAFSGNNITSVDIESGVTDIPASFFSRNSIASLTIPDGVVNIERQAFSDNNISGNITFPPSVKEIKQSAFQNNNLTSVSYANGTNITPSAFDPDVTITVYQP